MVCCSLKELVVNKSCIQEPHLATIKHKPSISVLTQSPFSQEIQEHEINVQHVSLNCKVYVHMVAVKLISLIFNER